MKSFNESITDFQEAQRKFNEKFNNNVEKALLKIEQFITNESNYNSIYWSVQIQPELTQDECTEVNRRLVNKGYPSVTFNNTYVGQHDSPATNINIESIRKKFRESTK